MELNLSPQCFCSVLMSPGPCCPLGLFTSCTADPTSFTGRPWLKQRPDPTVARVVTLLAPTAMPTVSLRHSCPRHVFVSLVFCPSLHLQSSPCVFASYFSSYALFSSWPFPSLYFVSFFPSFFFPSFFLSYPCYASCVLMPSHPVRFRMFIIFLFYGPCHSSSSPHIHVFHRPCLSSPEFVSLYCIHGVCVLQIFTSKPALCCQ